jgi:hypothetical protein
MNEIHVKEVRHPNGYVIGTQFNPPFWSYYNDNGQWAGSGSLYGTREEADRVKAELLLNSHNLCPGCGKVRPEDSTLGPTPRPGQWYCLQHRHRKRREEYA